MKYIYNTCILLCIIESTLNGARRGDLFLNIEFLYVVRKTDSVCNTIIYDIQHLMWYCKGSITSLRLYHKLFVSCIYRIVCYYYSIGDEVFMMDKILALSLNSQIWSISRCTSIWRSSFYDFDILFYINHQWKLFTKKI